MRGRGAEVKMLGLDDEADKHEQKPKGQQLSHEAC